MPGTLRGVDDREDQNQHKQDSSGARGVEQRALTAVLVHAQR